MDRSEPLYTGLAVPPILAGCSADDSTKRYMIRRHMGQLPR
jgi:hypothetical protein